MMRHGAHGLLCVLVWWIAGCGTATTPEPTPNTDTTVEDSSTVEDTATVEDTGPLDVSAAPDSDPVDTWIAPDVDPEPDGDPGPSGDATMDATGDVADEETDADTPTLDTVAQTDTAGPTDVADTSEVTPEDVDEPDVMPPCVEDIDCDDALPCTDDQCFGGECVHFAVDDCCMTDDVCSQPPQECAIALCLDNLCVTDTSGCAEALTTVSTAAGDTPQGWLDGPVDEAMFGEVRGLAIDSSGMVYLADWMTHSVRTIANGMVDTLAGQGCANGQYSAMSPPICGDYVDGLVSDARFDMPLEVAVSEPGPTVWVSDMFNFSIRKIVDGYVTTALGTGEQGYVDGPAETAQMGFVGGLVVRPDGELLFSDGSVHAIRSLVDGMVTTVTGTGSPGFADGPAEVAEFNEPVGLALTADGGVVIADWHNHRVRLLLDGEVTTLAGSGELGFTDGPVHEATFNEPGGVAVTSGGVIYVSDFSNHAIRRIADGVVTTVAGTGVGGYLDGLVESAEFHAPIDVAVDPFDNLWVSDNQNRAIRLLTP